MQTVGERKNMGDAVMAAFSAVMERLNLPYHPSSVDRAMSEMPTAMQTADVRALVTMICNG